MDSDLPRRDSARPERQLFPYHSDFKNYNIVFTSGEEAKNGLLRLFGGLKKQLVSLRLSGKKRWLILLIIFLLGAGLVAFVVIGGSQSRKQDRRKSLERQCHQEAEFLAESIVANINQACT